MGQDIKATDQDFKTAFNGFRAQAEAHGLDVTEENMRQFLVHISEVDAQTHAELRKCYSVNHQLMGMS